MVAYRDGKVYLEQIEGIPTEIMVNGKLLKNVKVGGLSDPIYKNIYLIDSDTAGKLFLEEADSGFEPQSLNYKKIADCVSPHNISIGARDVAEQPDDLEFEKAAVYIIDLPKHRAERLLDINYRGDVARLYVDGKLVEDNFYNGRSMQYGLWRIPESCNEVELRILPLQQDMPVYFPKEADYKKTGEELISVRVI